MAKLGKPGGKAAQHAARKARLAAALRENLKRRKQQARARAQAPEAAISERGRSPIETDYVRLERTSEPQSANVEVPDFRRNQGGE